MFREANLLIKDGILYEAILTAMHEGKPYAAPVGFIKRGNIVEIRAYKGGSLSKVVSTCPVVTLNFTCRPDLFILTAFKGKFIEGSQTLPLFKFGDGNVVYLSDCFGYIVLNRVALNEFEEYNLVRYSIKERVLHGRLELEPYSRCYSQLIELAVIASKIEAIKDASTQEDLLLKFKWCMDTINKTCSEDYKALAERLWVLVQACRGK